MAHRRCVQGPAGDHRVYRGCTGTDRENTGEDRGFSHGQGFLKPDYVFITFSFVSTGLANHQSSN